MAARYSLFNGTWNIPRLIARQVNYITFNNLSTLVSTLQRRGAGVEQKKMGEIAHFDNFGPHTHPL